MGSSVEELGHQAREGPLHEVTVPTFALAKYPVTQSQWQIIAAQAKINLDLPPMPSHFRGIHRPVEQVSWYQAVEFCQRLSRMTNRLYRLPSEAEWEYACRACTTTPFYFGETMSTDQANYDGNFTYGNGQPGVYRQQTTDVGTFPANGFGLHDMHGNVWEWCQDAAHDTYEGAPSDGSAWIEAGLQHQRIRRGGSWADLPHHCRSAFRVKVDPDYQDFNLGFRICTSVVELPG